MKALLILTVALFGIWLWRSGRRIDQEPGDETGRNASQATPQEMVRCAHCGTHLPSNEAVKGPHGLYCSAEHRQAAES
jgi:uncharacterized protein